MVYFYLPDPIILSAVNDRVYEDLKTSLSPVEVVKAITVIRNGISFMDAVWMYLSGWRLDIGLRFPEEAVEYLTLKAIVLDGF